MNCTKCELVIQRGEKYRRTKRGPHHEACAKSPDASSPIAATFCPACGQEMFRNDQDVYVHIATLTTSCTVPPGPLPPPQEPQYVPGAYRSDGPCKDCGLPCLPWFAPNEIWNKVVPERSGLLCPVCFLERAFKAGIDGQWILKPEFHDEEKARTDQSATSPQSESQNAESVFSQESLASPPKRKEDSSETLSAGETRTEAPPCVVCLKEGDCPHVYERQRVQVIVSAVRAAAESRIAQLEREKKSLQIQLDSAAEILREHTSRLLTAEAALIQAQAERAKLIERLDNVTHKNAFDFCAALRKELKAARVYEQVKEKI